MLTLIGLALLNGVLIGTSRAINGRLGSTVGALPAAWWNHAVGFVFLSVLLAAFHRAGPVLDTGAPVTAWLGGVLGVAFVALNSHVLPRLGAGRTTGFVVAAQMLASLVIDGFNRPTSPLILVSLGGAALIIAGVWLFASAPRQ